MQTSASQYRRGAFTLVEVMVSLALVTMVVVGVSQVFKMTTDATGALQGTSTVTRAHRSANSTFQNDFRNVVSDSPLFVIFSEVGWSTNILPSNGPNGAYRDANQHLNANATTVESSGSVDLNGTLVQLAVPSLNDRIPRMDSMSFFTRGVFRRQTWAANAVSSYTSAGECYVWYGHLNRVKPDYSGYLSPQNTYAQDRILGRVAFLMKDPATIVNNDVYWGTDSGVSDNLLAPLGVSSQLYTTDFSVSPPQSKRYTGNADTAKGFTRSILDARYDLAGKSIENFRNTVNNSFSNDANRTKLPPGTATTPLSTWHKPLSDVRFYCQPQVTRPLTSEKMAYAAPIFVNNCTQFVVEYAGDFLAQNEVVPTNSSQPSVGSILRDTTTGKVGIAEYVVPTTGNVVTGFTDGKIDFYYDPVTKTKRVRWYGLPRDANGDGRIWFEGVPHPTNERYDTPDVATFADIIRGEHLTGIPGNLYAPWEVYLPRGNAAPVKNRDYLNDNTLKGSAAASKFKYICAFHNRAPSMIRILMKIDDPTGKLQDGQWYEYVLGQ